MKCGSAHITHTKREVLNATSVRLGSSQTHTTQSVWNVQHTVWSVKVVESLVSVFSVKMDMEKRREEGMFQMCRE